MGYQAIPPLLISHLSKKRTKVGKCVKYNGLLMALKFMTSPLFSNFLQRHCLAKVFAKQITARNAYFVRSLRSTLPVIAEFGM